jgi:trk system potassium uptake protein TrkA
MYVVIDGGGKVGSYLARTLNSRGHSVAVIERRPDVIAKLSDELPSDVLLIQGDGCDVGYQEDAGVGHADVFAAVTGNDDDNLVACQIAKVTFNVKKAVARVNSPKNEHIFHALGIDAISSTSVISRLIEEEATIGEILHLYTLRKGQLSLVEIEIPAGEGVPEKRRVADLKLPEETVLVSIMRGDQVIIPKGGTVIRPGDRVLALASIAWESELRSQLLGE